MGIALSVLAIGVWQKLSSQEPSSQKPTSSTERYIPQPVAIAPTKINPPTTGAQGSLRVGNLTEHPVRIVLLSSSNSANNEPVNWDFVAGEGGNQGLQLSLPQQPIKVGAGDIIFGFATDGSRIYWGPLVVGNSESIIWQSDRQEWSLIIKP